ncbi:hypothetical protein bcCo53_000981 (plasmid) [Borrelia coriaceae]|uniref:Uncharacterized protein n=1 Tax=Borrelia coriaceae ATCC 43381 TaxID=1408429 RepID=W5T381_9SPIR|nr:hypothetical protein [Borrelia coriaceae]AHH11776.1 hypothetical protein BCO_0011005 [Borrelia coriaceae ATCC 43381]UPA16817.1 hypothetical protein bcCo53_000981 [Borrelia coriaceae]
MGKVISKSEIVKEMLSNSDDFENVLFNRKDDDGDIMFENLNKQGFTIGNAKWCLDLFLGFCKEDYEEAFECGITKINKKSLFVNKSFKLSMFLDRMLYFFNEVLSLGFSIEIA